MTQNSKLKTFSETKFFWVETKSKKESTKTNRHVNTKGFVGSESRNHKTGDVKVHKKFEKKKKNRINGKKNKKNTQRSK